MPPRRKYPSAPMEPADPALRGVRNCWRILMAHGYGKLETRTALRAVLHAAMRGLQDVPEDAPVFAERYLSNGI